LLHNLKWGFIVNSSDRYWQSLCHKIAVAKDPSTLVALYNKLNAILDVRLAELQDGMRSEAAGLKDAKLSTWKPLLFFIICLLSPLDCVSF
jgi:hypothetical protein